MTCGLLGGVLCGIFVFKLTCDFVLTSISEERFINIVNDSLVTGYALAPYGDLPENGKPYAAGG